MYNECKTRVSTVVGETEDISIEVDLQQGSGLNLFLFIIIGVLTEEIREEAPRAMLFAVNLVLQCEHYRGKTGDMEKAFGGMGSQTKKN